MVIPPEAVSHQPNRLGDLPGVSQSAAPAVGGGQIQTSALPPSLRACADSDIGFHRERLLLRLVTLILFAELLLFTAATICCAVVAQYRPLSEKSFCHRADRSLEAAFGVALNTLLALLGGKAASDSLR